MSEVKNLGYITIRTPNMVGWRSLALDVLGFAEGHGPNPDALYLRMDERAARIVVLPGEIDQVVNIGWEVRDGPALRRLRECLEAAGVAVTPLSLKDADSRRVEDAISFTDPTGAPLEAFCGPILDHSPVITPHGAKFITGSQGLGHVVLPTTDVGGAFTFYTEVLGFLPRGAMRLPAPPELGPMRIRFLGINQRHHSLALCPTPHGGAPGLIHIMVEVDSLDAVGQALDRVKNAGLSLSSTLGRHTNDKMVSFYVRAPGGWDIEFGTEGMKVDESVYTAEEITADSYWGHDWSGSQPLAAM
ncbi:VOC family protein [Mycolicibacter sinensis]|jgi:2,3-dihydroxybiphenyl 1,2-dioxygenase|uniref:2,3-dihydroxybiphenyl 1,2-dioxygenase n=1 Tax=Mycolicibacter sinensis (strain JDM601) TaxID=875328 RepID=A0A1A2EU59_MYCSD|nr:VOC family protein [Mycolicibacter sinensis]OBG03284.1 2,3-dihydroxybiphenyl 1,2-dioxygenase [Mycolicibacter sinensis]OBG07690.1 2,3-dihydroxybiphenyl 1,2-dioxygenase [Mycolicibacter sinensis]